MTLLNPDLSPEKFQFALPRGERPSLINGDNQILQVSIRAPAWGATERAGHDARIDHSFNSRSRVGSDSTRCAGSTSRRSFNSRSRVGSDLGAEVRPKGVQVSIRAPAWGATTAAQCSP